MFFKKQKLIKMFLSGIKGHVKGKGQIGQEFSGTRRPLKIAKVYERDVFPKRKIAVSKLKPFDPKAMAK